MAPRKASRNPIVGAYNAMFNSDNAPITRSVLSFGVAVALLATGFGEAFLVPA
ncbi:hypothetical protein QBC42DRAFT_289238 [Cladorrhinum samala]|uniref:Uncharacterized protein n=1 Tax=Cladorrhinum samala TaxID=585594 RepID=A0AAV9HHT0_9PEZI|nr:hypothetical protein QBC42DRAFT_289238 [Cladorrhinum samala]